MTEDQARKARKARHAIGYMILVFLIVMVVVTLGILIGWKIALLVVGNSMMVAGLFVIAVWLIQS